MFFMLKHPSWHLKIVFMPRNGLKLSITDLFAYILTRNTPSVIRQEFDSILIQSHISMNGVALFPDLGELGCHFLPTFYGIRKRWRCRKINGVASRITSSFACHSWKQTSTCQRSQTKIIARNRTIREKTYQ